MTGSGNDRPEAGPLLAGPPDHHPSQASGPPKLSRQSTSMQSKPRTNALGCFSFQRRDCDGSSESSEPPADPTVEAWNFVGDSKSKECSHAVLVEPESRGDSQGGPVRKLPGQNRSDIA